NVDEVDPPSIGIGRAIGQSDLEFKLLDIRHHNFLDVDLPSETKDLLFGHNIANIDGIDLLHHNQEPVLTNVDIAPHILERLANHTLNQGGYNGVFELELGNNNLNLALLHLN